MARWFPRSQRAIPVAITIVRRKITGCDKVHAMSREPGHPVLVVPVPALEPFVRARWEHYAPELVSTDPAFTHAHITALAPYLRSPRDEDLQRVADIAAGTPAFDFELRDVEVFPDGLIHLEPDPIAPFAALTARLWEAFPQCPPYGGRYDDVTPHLTLDRRSPSVTAEGTRAALGGLVPVSCRADRLELHWYETGNCHVRRSWRLGTVIGDTEHDGLADSRTQPLRSL